jgi:hypothetical protein
VRSEEGRPGVPARPLVVGRTGDQGTLPLFGCEEEALTFLRHAGFGRDWRVSKTFAMDITA